MVMIFLYKQTFQKSQIELAFLLIQEYINKKLKNN